MKMEFYAASRILPFRIEPFPNSIGCQAVATVANITISGYFADYFPKLLCYVYSPFGRCASNAGLLPWLH
jgi:hypothetical protein